MWPFRKKDPVVSFWGWFAENGERFRDPKSADARRALDKLHQLLRAIRPGLVAEFTCADERAVEIAISADGQAELFDAVTDVVKAAPPLEGWKVSAFRQPGNTDVTIRFGGTTLSAADIWFARNDASGRVDLVLYVRGMDETNYGQLGGAVMILLDNALGEYAMATAIGSVDFAPLPPDPTSAGLIPFVDLPPAVGLQRH
jgi:hypothetical protein